MKSLDKSQKEEYRYERHHFYLSKSAGKQVCFQCGLVGLRNKASEWCLEKGCQYKLHPSYRSTMKKLTKKFDF